MKPTEMGTVDVESLHINAGDTTSNESSLPTILRSVSAVNTNNANNLFFLHVYLFQEVTH